MRSAVLCSTLSLLVAGCVYPRRSTSLSEVLRPDASASISAPADVWRVTLVSADIAPRKRGDLPWDEGEGRPDAFVRIYRGAELLFETDAIDDSLAPRWEATLPRNVRVSESSVLRFEVWDRDTFGSDPIGQRRTRGRPSNAVEGADARLAFDGGSSLTVRFEAPRPHRGIGIAEYELRPDALVVLEVIAHSPAGRAGIEPGDRVVRVGDRAVSAMSANEAASALSMALGRGEDLVIEENGRERTVDLDRGYVWLTM